jgi:hypothetical protein
MIMKEMAGWEGDHTYLHLMKMQDVAGWEGDRLYLHLMKMQDVAGWGYHLLLSSPWPGPYRDLLQGRLSPLQGKGTTDHKMTCGHT